MSNALQEAMKVKAQEDVRDLMLFLESGPGDDMDRYRLFEARIGPEMAKMRRAVYRDKGMLPVPIKGDIRRGLKKGYFSTRLRDGTLGYFQRRFDDCLQAAIASLLQTPMPTVPDLRIGQKLANGMDHEELEREIAGQMGRWVDRCGVTVYLHTSPPTFERRWIGVIPSEIPGGEHCLLMTGSDYLFDPSSPFPPTNKRDPTEIEFAITIE
jgi:hypothetical protein